MRATALYAAIVLLTGTLCLTVVVSAQQHAQPAAQHAHAMVMPVAAAQAARSMTPAPPGPLPPLPTPPYPAARPIAVVRAAYEFAARHPEVLSYVPCYCGCETLGHGGNEDCFVRSRDAQGHVTWEEHGYGCTICVDVARDAMLMFNSGASVAQIRAAIEAKWGARYPTHTPTPAPPRAGRASE